VLSVYLVHWVVELLQVLDFLLNVLEDVLVLHTVDWSNKILQRCYFLLDFVKVMLVIHNNWIVQLFYGV